MEPEDREPVRVHRPVAAWSRRALERFGVFAVWAVGLAVVAVALGSLGVIWLSRQPAGSRLSIAFANRALAQVSDMRLTARRSLLLEHGALLTDAHLESVDSTGTRHTLLTAGRLEITTSWWELVSRQPRGFRIKVEHPTVTLTRDRNGALVLPRFHAPPRTGRPASPLTFDLDLKGGIVRVRTVGETRADTVARDLTLVARAHGGGVKWDAALGRLSADLPRMGLTLQKAEGQARLADGNLALDRLRARTDAGWVEVSAKGSVSPNLDLEGDVRFGEWAWHDVARLAHQPSLDIEGGAAGRGRVRLTREAIVLTGVEGDVLWRNEPVRTRFDGRWSAGRLVLTDARVDWRKTAFDGGFELEPAKGHWRIDGALAALDLSELPRLWPMTELEPVVVGGRIDLTGDRAGLRARVAGATARTADWQVDEITGTWSLAGATQTVDATARAAGGALSARGTLGRGILDANVAATGIEAKRVPASWWRALGLDAAPEGRVEALSAHMNGPVERPQVRGEAHVTGVAQDAFQVTDAKVQFDGTLGRDYSVRTKVRSEYARVNFAEADSATAELVVAPTRIELVQFQAQRAESVLVAQGRAERAGEAWNLHLTRLAWDAGDRIALENDGPIEARLEPGGALFVEQARVVSTAGALTARGLWGGKSRASDLELDLESLDLEALLGPLATKLRVRGVLTGKARLEGQPAHATWTIDLDASDLHYKDYTARRLFARGRFADDSWRIERLILDTGRGTASFEGGLEWAEPPPWSGTTEDWNKALARVPRWSGTLVTDSLALGQIAELYPQAGGWRGALSIRCVLGGRPAAPEVALTGRLGRPGWGQVTLGDFDLDLDYRDELITVRKCAMAGPDSAGPALTGRLPLRLGWGVPASERVPDRPMELVAFARGMDVGLVPLILPQIAAAGGAGDFDARLTGTPRQPLVNGQVTVRDAVVRPANREEVLTAVNGTVRLSGGELRVEHFEARQGKQGRLVVVPGGVAHFKNLRISDYALDVEASHVTAYASGEYVIEIDGRFRVANGLETGGPMPLPHITGTANVIEGVFLINFADPELQAASQGPATLPPWTYAINVEARNNVWWRPSEANIEAKLIDFEIRQELDRFVMLGGLESLRGRYYFLGNQFDVETGRIFFDLAQPMNPTIDAMLTTEKPISRDGGTSRETIVLRVNGRAREPDVNLTSEPTGLSQSEIAQLLTTGQLAGGVAGSQVGQATASYLMRELMEQWPEFAKHFGYVDVSSRTDDNSTSTGTSGGTPGSNTNVKSYTTVGVSRYFTRDLLVRYSQVVGDVSQAQNIDYLDLGAEYRLNELLFLRGQVTRRKTTTLVTTQDETLYNLDVRARHEY